MRRHRTPGDRQGRTLLGVLGLALLLFDAGSARAGGEGAIWTRSFEHSEGVKISLVTSEPLGAPSAMRACFVLSNTNSPPGGVLGTVMPVSARITADDVVGSGLPFDFVSTLAVDVGGYPVACSIGGGGSTGVMVPGSPSPAPGVIPAATVTNKCCFRIEAPPAPPAPARGGAALFSAGAASCDPAYPECFPGEGDELVYELFSNTGSESSAETIYIWTLGAPGCGLVSLEALAVVGAVRLGRRVRRKLSERWRA